MKSLNIGSDREVFWDDYLIDTEQTTAFPQLMHPEKKEYCFTFDQGNERNSLAYPCIVKDDKGYKMYYLAAYATLPDERVPHSYEAVLESSDGLHWTRPQRSGDRPGYQRHVY